MANEIVVGAHRTVMDRIFPLLNVTYKLACLEACYGCSVDHPSQSNHNVCCMMIEEERIQTYITRAFLKLDVKNMVKICQSHLKYMDPMYKAIAPSINKNYILFVLSLENTQAQFHTYLTRDET